MIFYDNFRNSQKRGKLLSLAFQIRALPNDDSDRYDESQSSKLVKIKNSQSAVAGIESDFATLPWLVRLRVPIHYKTGFQPTDKPNTWTVSRSGLAFLIERLRATD